MAKSRWEIINGAFAQSHGEANGVPMNTRKCWHGCQNGKHVLTKATYVR